MNITIRPAAIDDAARIAELSGQLGYPTTAEAVAARLAAIGGHEDHELSVGTLPGGVVAGWIHIYVRRVVMIDPMVEIDGLVVDERYRRAGIGTRLMDHAEAWSRDRGIDVVNLHSNVIREGSHAFYRSLGYEYVKRQMVLQKKLR